MNKLIFFCLLSLMVVYTQSKDKCSDLKEAESADACKNAEVSEGKTCEYVAPTSTEDGAKGSCKEVAKATNSSDNLNIFKVTLALLIIFAIL